MDQSIKNAKEYAVCVQDASENNAERVEKKDRVLGEKLRKIAAAAKEVVKHIEDRTDTKKA